jgi:type IV pilus assembly protein PilW
MTLIELLVGISVGLLVVAVSMAALMVSRGVAGTVTDASDIQQQAAYAMRLIGGELRQAGSLELDLNAAGSDGALGNDMMAPVALLQKSVDKNNPDYAFDLTNSAKLLSGTTSNTNESLTIGFSRHKEPVFTSKTPVTLSVNCVGGPSDTNASTVNDRLVESIFKFNTTSNQLTCLGNHAVIAQPVVQNVANFRVRYLVESTAAPGQPQIQYFDAKAATTHWAQVHGVEVCLVLYGTESIPMPNGSTYTDCDGTTRVDMTTLAGARKRRMHLVFRNVFQLRSREG